MKKLLFLNLLISVASLRAVSTTLADAQTMTDNLGNAGFEHFAVSTGVVQFLADTTQTPLEISNQVEFFLFDYSSCVPPQDFDETCASKWDIVGALVKDSSNERGVTAELGDLIETGILK